MSKRKTYKIEFYTAQVGADGKAGKVSKQLDALSELPHCPVITIGTMSYEIRDLTPSLHKFPGSKGRKPCK